MWYELVPFTNYFLFSSLLGSRSGCISWSSLGLGEAAGLVLATELWVERASVCSWLECWIARVQQSPCVFSLSHCHQPVPLGCLSDHSEQSTLLTCTGHEAWVKIIFVVIRHKDGKLVCSHSLSWVTHSWDQLITIFRRCPRSQSDAGQASENPWLDDLSGTFQI